MNRIQERSLARKCVADPQRALDTGFFHASVGYAGGIAYKALHPELNDDQVADLAGFCCEGLCMYDVTRCTCWEPVYEAEQQPAQPSGLQRLEHPARRTRCADCAFRRDSPERSDEYEEEELLALAVGNDPFWCRQGMRRPVVYRHPKLGDVPGVPADYDPLILDGVPYQADGTPGLICAGWTQERRRLAVSS